MKKTLFLFIVFMLSGCANVQVTMYNKNIHYPPTDPKSVEIFQTKPTDKKFIEIGEITVEGATDMNQVGQIFRSKAAEYGGNAVYIYNITQQTMTYVDPPGMPYFHTGKPYSYEGFSYPHGRYSYHAHYYPRGHYHFHHYYYNCCYHTIGTATYLNVVGIVIRYT